MKTVTREEVCKRNKIYEDMLRYEKHHDHEIVKEANGNLRWKETPGLKKLIDENLKLDNIWLFFYYLRYNKNSEFIRDLYRKMGYSLLGYWEIFYWETNNELTEEYRKNYNEYERRKQII